MASMQRRRRQSRAVMKSDRRDMARGAAGLSALGLAARRLLPRLLRRARPGVRLSEHLDGDGETIFRHACALGAEGIVAKRRDRLALRR